MTCHVFETSCYFRLLSWSSSQEPNLSTNGSPHQGQFPHHILALFTMTTSLELSFLTRFRPLVSHPQASGSLSTALSEVWYHRTLYFHQYLCLWTMPNHLFLLSLCFVTKYYYVILDTNEHPYTFIIISNYKWRTQFHSIKGGETPWTMSLPGNILYNSLQRFTSILGNPKFHN